MTSNRTSGAFAALAALLQPLPGEMSAEGLADRAQNPMGNLFGLPCSTRFKRIKR
jgi:hypothetical protein